MSRVLFTCTWALRPARPTLRRSAPRRSAGDLPAAARSGVRLYPLPFPFHGALGAALFGVQVRQPLGVALVALGELVLLARFGVSVPGQHAGVVAALLGQFGDIV